MNENLQQIIKLANEALSRNLPDVKKSDLEENGKLYYMNGDDGTIFDWGMNERLCEFMSFYDDSGMGAIKINVMANGTVWIYSFKNRANSAFKTEKFEISESGSLELAVLMEKIADQKGLFDKAVDDMENDTKIGQEDINKFLENFDE